MPTPSEFERATYAKVDRRLIPFLFLCYILAYLDRVNVGFAKLQMLSDLHLSEAAFAAGAGIFFIGYFFFEVPSNVLLKKYGARVWIARIMVSWGLISAAMVFVAGEWQFYALRFTLGLAEAGFFPGIIYYLTLWYPCRLRASRNAGFVAAVAVSGVIGNPVSGLIMDTLSGTLGLSGWQWLFLAEGLPSALVGVWVLFHLDSGIEQAAWLTRAEKDLLAANIKAEDCIKTELHLADAFKSPKVYVLCAIYFSLVVGLYGVTFWLPTIVDGFGDLDYLEIGLISAIPYAVATVGMVLASRSSDRTGLRRAHFAAATAAGAAGLILCGLFPQSPAVSVACLSLGATGIIAGIPLFWPMPSAFLAGTAAAAGIGLINSVGNLGGYVGPSVPIWVGHFLPGQAAPLYVIAAVLLAGAALTLACLPQSVDADRTSPDRLSRP